MKWSVRAVQIFVGLLFIVSGLVKANDPLGLSYKMQEFFELWSEGFAQGAFIRSSLDFFHKSSLALSISMIALEIVAGVALLIGWQKKFILWLLLLLIIFFTFLTGYAYLSGKFTNCGCFGDCLPITPLTSFLKDILLLVLIVFLLWGQKYIAPVFTSKLRVAVLSLSLVLTLTFQWYVLNYLPVADCLPFKKGNSIAEQMKPPAGSKPDSIAMKFIYEKEGKRYEWGMNELPSDLGSYKYIDRVDKVVRKGNADPPIKGFSLVGLSGQDSLPLILSQPFAIVAFTQNIDSRWVADFKNLAEAAKAKNTILYLGSSDLSDASKILADVPNVQLFNVDFTVVRTVARTSPTILFLKQGAVVKKYSKMELQKAATDLAKQNF